MNKKDLSKGVKVHHYLFRHWGEGEIIEKTTITELKSRGYKVYDAWLVLFQNGNKTKCKTSDLRKTKRKVKEGSYKVLCENYERQFKEGK